MHRRFQIASSFSKAFVYLFIVGMVLSVSRPAIGQELLELARAQAMRYPGLPVQIPSPPGHYERKTVDQLTNEAVAVVQAKLSRIRSYVGGSRGDRVLTDYLIIEPAVIAGQLPALVQRVPSSGTSPILTVYGGEVVIEGVTVRCTDTDRAAIEDGAQHLIFLRPARTPGTSGTGRYEIHYGGIFEVSADEVKALLKNADDVFSDFLQERPKPKDLVARIQKAAQHR
jgi:hypothetical protein